MDEGILESSFNAGLNYNQNLYLGKEKEEYETMLNTLSSNVIATGTTSRKRTHKIDKF